MRADDLLALVHPQVETEPHRRARLTQITLDKFRDQPFEFGTCDCVRIAAFHLKQFGYKPGLSRGGAYKTANGARAALKRAGFKSLTEAIDKLGLPRIAPLQRRIGDLLMGDGAVDEFGFGALGVYLGNGRLLTFAEGEPNAVVIELKKNVPTITWEVRPRG